VNRIVWIMLGALALVLAACGGGDTAPDTAGERDGTPESQSVEQDSTDPEDESTVTTGEAVAPDTAVEPIELTATWKGVSADTIQVGVAAIDAEALRAFDVDLGFIDATKAYPALAAAFNASGGANGRDVEVTVELFLPVGSTDSDRACSVLAEDVGVFLTVGQMLGDNPLCFTELNAVPYVGAFGLTDARDRRSDGQFYSYQPQVEPQRRNSLVLLDDAGVFDGARVGLFWEIADRSLVDDVIRPTLTDLGIDVVSEGELDDFAGDTPASEAAADRIFERFSADGADLLLNVSGLVSFNRTVERSGYDGRLVFLNGQMNAENIIQDSGYDPAVLAGAVGAAVAGAELDEMLADDLWRECVDVLNASGEFDVTFVPEELDKPTAGSIRQTCGTWKLMEAMLIAAGPELTPDSLREGAESLGTFTLPGVPTATMGPGDHSAADAVRLFEYDREAIAFVPAGDPVVIG
jgi:hypothetical protein